ncbi:LuxR C-terminal-related transcriptional regulator [uncultured Microbulbifer sp.]|uniref:LuxR C-terminal-related transcriptional regulator n=1 Tax=uncultured Microbulbifer sp. TaxID=348147 RepID=UPI00261063B3|nr:LuxR C-terminal-related transcriptional regulator [uncultured Microbulbifer sp.]
MAEKILEQKPQTELLKDVWGSRKELFAQRKTELAQFRVNELISSIFSNGPFYHYVFDLFDLDLLYVSPEVEQIHDLSLESVTFQDILDQMHPDDMDFVARAEATAIRLFQEKIGMHKVTDYKISYCFRFRVKDGSYHLFNHQSVVLTTDSQGGVGKSLNVHTDISHLTSTNNQRLSLIGMRGEPSYLDLVVDGNVQNVRSAPPIFTQREISVIERVARGMTSAEIGRDLQLSEYTIKNHRKRILKKGGCQNMSQLLALCITEGLI